MCAGLVTVRVALRPDRDSYALRDVHTRTTADRWRTWREREGAECGADRDLVKLWV